MKTKDSRIENGKSKSVKWNVITWFALAVIAGLFYWIATGFIVFPKKLKLPLLAVIGVILLLTGLLSFTAKKKRKTISTIINILLSVCMLAGCFFLPSLETRMKKIFTSEASGELTVNVYAFSTEYKNEHPETVLNGHKTTPENIKDFEKPQFIIQTLADQKNQANALDQLKEELNTDSLDTVQKEDILSAAEAFYAGEAELFVLNPTYTSMLEETEDFKSFTKDTVVVYSASIKQDNPIVEKPVEKIEDITNTAFTVFVAGSDTRGYGLSTYGRTDVNLILTVNPATKQILVTGVPRDAYVPNPAYGYAYDKLTHLGNDGIYNTMAGLEETLGLTISDYFVVNFSTFKNIVDAVDGIDIYNPYYFTTYGGNGGYYSNDYEFPEGDIHLTGDSALAYVRERYNLPDGDYGRNEHQTIVIKGILEKITTSSIISNYDALLSALEGQFMTSMNPDDIYKLAQMQVDEGGSWDIIIYHLGGEGVMQGTASMGWDRALYTVSLFDTQIAYIQEQTEKLKNGEKIEQSSLPDSDDTTYIPN